MKYIPRWLGCLAAALGLQGGVAAAQVSAPPQAMPVVVELFTSQGCNSCPPADAYLAELARRPGVVALSLHVDYWDYMGWKDPYAQRAFTDRQRAYSRALGLKHVYTPQMVVNGRLQDVGSERAAIERLIEKARRSVGERPVVRLVGEGAGAAVRVEGPSIATPAAVWFLSFDRSHSTSVLRGENKGRTLANHNVVREWRRLGSFSGGASEYPLAVRKDTPGDAGAVLLQSNDTGPILAVLSLDKLPGR